MSEMAELRADVKEILQRVAKIEQRLDSAPTPCPAPGMCLSIQQDVEALKLVRAQIKGGSMVLTALCGFIGAAMGWVVTWWSMRRS